MVLASQRDPGRVPADIVERLKAVGLWNIDPLNLFRIGWHSEPVESGGVTIRSF
jgi:cysteine synthase